jgi:hypothetical protein
VKNGKIFVVVIVVVLLLAAGAVGFGIVSHCVVVDPSVPFGGYHCRGGVRFVGGDYHIAGAGDQTDLISGGLYEAPGLVRNIVFLRDDAYVWTFGAV